MEDRDPWLNSWLKLFRILVVPKAVIKETYRYPDLGHTVSNL